MVRPSHPGRPAGSPPPFSPAAVAVAETAFSRALPDVVDIGYLAAPVTDPDTLVTSRPFVTVHPAVDALIEPDQPRDRTVQFGDAPVYVGAMFVAVPLHIADVEEGWQVRVTESHDPRSVGARLTVRDSEHSSVFPVRYLICTETTRGDA